MLSRNFGSILFIFSVIKYSTSISLVSRKNVNASKLEGKIIGGTIVDLEAYPYAVQFFNKGGMCGGAILNSWTVITSAHCFASNNDTKDMIVQAGSKYMYDFNSNSYNVKSFVVHEKYNIERPFACDIALIFVHVPIKFGDKSKKAILVDHNGWMKKSETKFIVTGWGWTKYRGEVSESLMMTHLRYVPAEECSRLHGNYVLTADMFCLYGSGERDTCRGDSGGGVQWNDVLVGLTSHGDGCAKKDNPSIYTNLWVFRDWIKVHINQFIRQYCSVSGK